MRALVIDHSQSQHPQIQRLMTHDQEYAGKPSTPSRTRHARSDRSD
jgi:hypothetical protein